MPDINFDEQIDGFDGLQLSDNFEANYNEWYFEFDAAYKHSKDKPASKFNTNRCFSSFNVEYEDEYGKQGKRIHLKALNSFLDDTGQELRIPKQKASLEETSTVTARVLDTGEAPVNAVAHAAAVHGRTPQWQEEVLNSKTYYVGHALKEHSSHPTIKAMKKQKEYDLTVAANLNRSSSLKASMNQLRKHMSNTQRFEALEAMVAEQQVIVAQQQLEIEMTKASVSSITARVTTLESNPAILFGEEYERATKKAQAVSLDAQGVPRVDIASRLGMHRKTIARWLGSDVS